MKKKQEQKKEVIINLENKEYTKEDLTQQQFYFVQQIRSCQIKAADLRLQLNQLMMAEKGFTAELTETIKQSSVDDNPMLDEALKDE